MAWAQPAAEIEINLEVADISDPEALSGVYQD